MALSEAEVERKTLQGLKALANPKEMGSGTERTLSVHPWWSRGILAIQKNRSQTNCFTATEAHAAVMWT